MAKELTESRRTRYTRRAMQDALIDLMRERPLGSITIKALCEQADVNRSTFYAHYDSIAALHADARAFPVEPITPWVEERDAQKFITIPADLGFPVTEEMLDGLWRG